MSRIARSFQRYAIANDRCTRYAFARNASFQGQTMSDDIEEGKEGKKSPKKSKLKSDGKLPIDIRYIELEDLAPVYSLGEVLFAANLWSSLHRTWDEYEVLNLYMTDSDTCFVAEYEGRVVGFALGATIQKRRSSWKYGYLIWLGVSPELKGQGVGKRLVRRLTEAFIQEGARMMLVDTDGENEDAVEFFHRAGFGADQQHVYMSMNLTKHPSYDKHRPKREDGMKREDHAKRDERLREEIRREDAAKRDESTE